ncbi:MAG: hypothetical protein GY753_16970 [Gammaproteobacteria bacterium]|nr:hypothetical protein [Gammaproteobacteria bacterium]
MTSHIIRHSSAVVQGAVAAVAAIQQIDAEEAVLTGDYVEFDGCSHPIVEAIFGPGETWSAITDTSIPWDQWDWRREDS